MNDRRLDKHSLESTGASQLRNTDLRGLRVSPYWNLRTGLVVDMPLEVCLAATNWHQQYQTKRRPLPLPLGYTIILLITNPRVVGSTLDENLSRPPTPAKQTPSCLLDLMSPPRPRRSRVLRRFESASVPYMFRAVYVLLPPPRQVSSILPTSPFASSHVSLLFLAHSIWLFAYAS